MARANHVAASILLAAGIVLVFAGLSSALGFTAFGMLASVAVIAGLLYAGGTWFGASAPAAPRQNAVLFDHALQLPTGTGLLAEFPEELRGEIRVRCQVALAGEHTRFTIQDRVFQVAPVAGADGVVIYGVLIEGAAASPLSLA